MTAFEVAREAADRHDQKVATTDDGARVLVDDGEYVLRESPTAWIATADIVEVTQ